MSTQPTSSGSSSSINAPEPALTSSRIPSTFLKVSPKTQKRLGFYATQETLELLHQFVNWETVEDLDMAYVHYTKISQKIDNDDIGKELDTLKALHSAMMRHYDIYMKLIEDVEIGDDVEEDKDIKFDELNLQISSINDICSPVNDFIRILEFSIEKEMKNQMQERSGTWFSTEYKDSTVGEKRKRNLGTVEKGLLDVLMRVGGKTSVDKISTPSCTERWEYIVDGFNLIVESSTV